jgi:hypothetical protein
MSPREQAAVEVEREKRDRALDEAAARRRIQVAEVFAVGDATTNPPPPKPAPESGAAPKPAANSKSAAPQTTPARKSPARRTP